MDHHLLLQNILSGPGYLQFFFSSLQLFQLLLQMFHHQLQLNVKVRATGSFSGLSVDMRLVALVSQYLLSVELIGQFSNLRGGVFQGMGGTQLV